LISDFVRDPGLARDVAIRGRQSVLSAFSPETTRAELAETYQAAVDRDARGAAFAGAVALRQSAADASDR
jgi:hypothetical protein